MPHLTRSSARTFHVHEVAFHSYASSATGAAQLGAWRAEFAPRTPGRAHRMTDEEVLYVLEGSLEIEVDMEHFSANAGDAILVPAGARLRVSNSAEEPAAAWVTTSLGMAATMESDGQRLTPPWAQ